MAQSEPCFHTFCCCIIIGPRLFLHPPGTGAMQTINGRKYAKLHPAQQKLHILVAAHMTADVVTPPAVTDVGRCSGKVGLKLQRFPSYGCITGEADGIPVAAGTGIAGEKHRPLAISGNVQNMQMVQHPQRIHPFSRILIFSGCIRLMNPVIISSLLPIHPPKIYSLFFIGMMEDIEIVGHKVLR